MEPDERTHPEEILRRRPTTERVLVHFTGEETGSYHQIKKNHQARGLKEIGYHFIIEPDGKILRGRAPDLVGAHCAEFDTLSIGICVIGRRDAMDDDQQLALTLLLDQLGNDYPEIRSVQYLYPLP